MRALPGRSLALRATGFSSREYGWLQAGFSSFAYRLAHLAVPRAVAATVLSLLFYLV